MENGIYSGKLQVVTARFQAFPGHARLISLPPTLTWPSAVTEGHPEAWNPCRNQAFDPDSSKEIKEKQAQTARKSMMSISKPAISIRIRHRWP